MTDGPVCQKLTWKKPPCGQLDWSRCPSTIWIELPLPLSPRSGSTAAAPVLDVDRASAIPFSSPPHDGDQRRRPNDDYIPSMRSFPCSSRIAMNGQHLQAAAATSSGS